MEERLEEEQSCASCLNIEEWDEGIPDTATFLDEEACKCPHPWKVTKEKIMSTFPCISIRKDREAGHLVHNLKQQSGVLQGLSEMDQRKSAELRLPKNKADKLIHDTPSHASTRDVGSYQTKHTSARSMRRLVTNHQSTSGRMHG
ncbi:hypothetical protein LIER_12009 [Lithospermum erythrorhizon]|uniref:Uncharacterized protein n=1 Tax=Lithospermum erythrorhizon TaxID=34254 RepID=A0AAV3PT36_LITER